MIAIQELKGGSKYEFIKFLERTFMEEGDLFFEDLSGCVIQDDVFARLLTFPNVVITGHQAFFTQTALENITDTTLHNISDFKDGKLKGANTVIVGMIK